MNKSYAIQCFLITVLFGLINTGCGNLIKNEPEFVRPKLVEGIVKEGMSQFDVINLLGTPGRFVEDTEHAMEAWTYYEDIDDISPETDIGGLTIVFQGQKVIKVMPIYVSG